jgi:ankyrin repeat protein
MMNIPAESGEWSAEWRRLRGLQGQAQLELLNTLLAHGANVNARITKEPPRFGHTFAGQIPNLAGATPFFLAAMAADTSVMRVLLAHGADARLATNANTTPLMAAVGCCIRSTSESAITESSALEAGKLLVENLGADVNAVNANGETALHGTAYLGYDTIAQYLVDKGAKLNVKNKNGWTPVAVADGVIFQQATQVHKSTADLLRKLGGTN